MGATCLLSPEDASANLPQVKQLAALMAQNTTQISEKLSKLQVAMSAIFTAEDQLISSYRQLALALQLLALEKSTICEGNDELKQICIQFSSMLDELAEFHSNLANTIRDPVGGMVTSFTSEVISLSSVVETCDKERENASSTYARLNKRCSPKVHDDTMMDLALRRRQFQQSTVLYYRCLNEAECMREIAPLQMMYTLMKSKQQFAKNLHNFLSQQPVLDITTTLKDGFHARMDQRRKMLEEFQLYLLQSEHLPLTHYCPEALRSPDGGMVNPGDAVSVPTANTSLHSKSGYLFMRLRVALLPKWQEVYCSTQNGNLWGQLQNEIAAHLVLDFNKKGVYVEDADVDDHRYVFQVVSPTERKTIILQAESEVVKEEWVATINNIIHDIGNWGPRSTGAVVVGCGDRPTSGSPARPLSPLDASEWLPFTPPPVDVDLPPLPRLLPDWQTAALETATSVETKPTTPDEESQQVSPDASLPTASEQACRAFEFRFLGSIQLPPNAVESIPFDEVFSYVLSFRSASQLSEGLACRLTITERDLWVLSARQEEATVKEDGNHSELVSDQVLLRVPFSRLLTWFVHPDNTKLAALVIRGPFGSEDCFITTTNVHICLTFQSNCAASLSEHLLEAQLKRMDVLQDSEDYEKPVLLKNITQLSEQATLHIQQSGEQQMNPTDAITGSLNYEEPHCSEAEPHEPG